MKRAILLYLGHTYNYSRILHFMLMESILIICTPVVFNVMNRNEVLDGYIHKLVCY